MKKRCDGGCTLLISIIKYWYYSHNNEKLVLNSWTWRREKNKKRIAEKKRAGYFSESRLFDRVYLNLNLQMQKDIPSFVCDIGSPSGALVKQLKILQRTEFVRNSILCVSNFWLILQLFAVHKKFILLYATRTQTWRREEYVSCREKRSGKSANWIH